MISCITDACVSLSFKLLPTDGDGRETRPEDVGKVVHSTRIEYLGELWGEYLSWRISPFGENLVQIDFDYGLAGDGWPAEIVGECFDEIELALAVIGVEFMRLYIEEG